MKKILSILIFISIGFISEAQLNINHYIRVGRTRISIENYVGAIEYFNIVIKFKPYLPEPYFYRGVAKHQLEDFRGAINDYNKAIEIKPYYPEAYSHRGMAFHSLKEYKKAIEDYNRALELNPDNEAVYNNRGLAKIALKDVEGAVADYNKALKVNPKSTTALMNRSNAKIIKGDMRGAINDLNKIIMIRPHFAGAYLNRGLARFEMNNYAAALRDYDLCIKFAPKNALAYNNRGIVKHKLGDFEGAIMDYDMAISLDPKQANAYFNRAMAKEILGREGFEKDYKIAALLNPQYDLSNYKIDSEQLAQNSKQKQGSQQKQQAQQNQPGQVNQTAQPPANQQTNKQQGSASNQGGTTLASNQPPKDAADGKEKEKEKAERLRRRKINLIIADNRNLPADDEKEVEDGKIQNKNIIIDLQPIFIISAFEKNAVDYERLQYYNNAIEALNRENNYNPMLTITNKSNEGYMETFNNFILYYNERIKIKESSHNFVNRGIFKCLTGDYNSALDDLNRAIEMEEKNSLAYFTRANARYKMIEHIESLPDFSKQLTVALNNSEDTRDDNDSQMQQMINDYNKILDDYTVALFLDPHFFFGYYNRAYINLRLARYNIAMNDLNKAIELEPEFAEAYFNRGLTKIYLNDLEGGALDLSRAGELGLHDAYNIIKRYCN